MAKRLPGCEIHIFDPSLTDKEVADVSRRAM